MKSRADQMTDFELGNQLSDWFDLKTESWSNMARRVRELFANSDVLVFVLAVDVVQSDGKIKTSIFERESPLDVFVPRVGEQVMIEHPSLGGGVAPKVESVTWLVGKGKLVVGLAMGRPIVGREASIIEGAGGWKRR